MVSTYGIYHPKLVQQFLVQCENTALCKHFTNAGIFFRWILLHEVLFFGFESLGNTGYQYIFHINYSWWNNRSAISWKTNKINSTPNSRCHRRLFICLVWQHPQKQAGKWDCFLHSSSSLASCSMVKPYFWHREEQLESSFKSNASTSIVHICSVEGCTAVCSGVGPEMWGVSPQEKGGNSVLQPEDRPVHGQWDGNGWLLWAASGAQGRSLTPTPTWMCST